MQIALQYCRYQCNLTLRIKKSNWELGRLSPQVPSYPKINLIIIITIAPGIPSIPTNTEVMIFNPM